VEFDLFRAEPIGSKNYGEWWTPNLKNTEPYHRGPLSSRIATAKTNLDDYSKAAQRAMLKSDRGSGSTLSNPKGIPLQERMKELEQAKRDLLDGKISLEKFTSEFPEGNYSKNKNLKPKTSYYQTAKPLLKEGAKQGTKFLGPIGAAYALFEYLKGTPVADATLYPEK